MYWVKIWLLVAMVFYTVLNLFEAYNFYQILKQEDPARWRIIV